MRVLGIAGSLRLGSYNAMLLAAAAAWCPPGVELERWRGLCDVPPFDEDAQEPLVVAQLRGGIARADAVLIATPEYNSSIPGALKNALDWASRPPGRGPLRGKPVAVVGASQGVFGAVWAQAELRKVLRAMGAQVDDRQLLVASAHHAFTGDGRLRDTALDAALAAIVADLVDRTGSCAA